MNRLETENQDLKKMSNELETSKHYLEQILEDGHDTIHYICMMKEKENITMRLLNASWTEQIWE